MWEVHQMPKTAAVIAEPQVCCSSITQAPLDEQSAIELAHVFAALADPVRLRLYSVIADAGEICSCDMLEPLGKAQPTVSHHTEILADAGLIAGENAGAGSGGASFPSSS